MSPWFPRTFFHILFWLACHTLYRVRTFGKHHVPAEGAALLVANHISWLDGVLIMTLSRRPVRSFVHAGNFRHPWLRWWALQWGAILVDSGPKSIARSLKEARQALADGERVLIFPEGGLSRTAQVRTFRPGMTRILKGNTDVPVIPIYLDGLWGSIFSFSGGKFFKKWPTAFRRAIDVHYGEPLAGTSSPFAVRQAIQQLGANAVSDRKKHAYQSLPIAAIKACKRRAFGSKVADTNGNDAKGGECLLRALILRRLLRRHALAADEKYIGILLPPSLGGVLTNFAISLDRRVAINLNYSVSSEVINECIQRAGIRHVLTSRQVMSKLELDLDAELVYLEDYKSQVTLGDKVAGAIGAYALPTFALSRMLGLHRNRGDDEMTVIFTSGSTGTPKGVVLSNDNIASNVEAVDQLVHLRKDDVVIGILPFFHSFGYAITLWTVLSLDIKGAYHYSPMDGKRVGQLVGKHAGTVLLSTPTFLRGYLKRCTPEQFKTLEMVVAGAEKLPVSLCDAFEQKFGVRPVEGYGCTELSPLVSVNVPPSRSGEIDQVDRKEGTVGRPIANVAAKTVNLETGEELGSDQEGMLLIAGPNVMQGYLHDPHKTAEVLRDGWYVTGDVACIDEDGFIRITGRESRFSKIGGEMVPHIRIEEELTTLLETEEEDALQVAVTAVPDAKKGERLIVLYTNREASVSALIQGLREAGLPNLFIPSEDNFLHVQSLPILGTGKLDLKGIKQLALELTGSEPVSGNETH